MIEPMFWSELKSIPEIGAHIELTGSEGKHAAGVRRMRVGEAIQITNGFGLRVRGSVVEVLAKSLFVEVAAVSQESESSNKLTLVQALAKGDRDELAVQAATELGVFAVVPWQAERSISRWDAAKAAKGQARWQIICDEAAKQSLRAFFPRVAKPSDTRDVAKSFADFDHVIVLDPTAEVGLASVKELSGRVAIVVGPEGGISDEELELFEQSGARRLRMGESILRTSTAGVAAISVIQALTGHYR